MDYKIEAVSPQVKEYETKYGKMKSYSLKLPNVDEPVQLSQKDSTPAPKTGDVLNGTIEDSEFGKKFKKAYSPPANGGGKSFGGGKAPFDQFTMYLSYAKDLAVALIDKTGALDKAAYAEVLADVAAGGYVLYEGRPEAKGDTEVKQVANFFGEDTSSEPVEHDPFEGMDLE